VVERGSRIRVAVGPCASLIACGLRHVLGREPTLRLVSSGRSVSVEAAACMYGAQVVVLDHAGWFEDRRRHIVARECTDIGVVVLAYEPSRACCVRALGLGANACVSITAPSQEIVHAVQLVAGGQQVFAAFAKRAEQRNHPSHTLTAREHAVLKLLSAARSNAEIACELHITVETVRSHVAHIYRKLGVCTRRDLVGLNLTNDSLLAVDGATSAGGPRADVRYCPVGERAIG
jgi:DNA-binding NarL/FixJ family response regulator